MKSFKPDIGIVLFIILFPLIITGTITINAILDPKIGESLTRVFWKSFDIYCKIIFGVTIMTLLSKRIIAYLNKQIGWKENWLRRLFFEFLLFLGLLALMTFTALYFFIPEGKMHKVAMLIIVMLNLSCIGFVELRLATIENVKLALALAESEKERVNSQLIALRQQVNPHFLFNSLNVLSSLIYDDQKKAEEFVHEFGDVYRYVLEINDEPVVTLQQELQFLDSYTFLQKIRFRDGLILNKKIDVTQLGHFLPPLTLQLLIENAIKHNIISEAHPFTIELYNEGDYLVVKNSLQPRKNKEKSFGLGLSNLKKKYDLISDLQPIHEVSEEWFVVKVPLLKSEDKE